MAMAPLVRGARGSSGALSTAETALSLSVAGLIGGAGQNSLPGNPVLSKKSVVRPRLGERQFTGWPGEDFAINLETNMELARQNTTAQVGKTVGARPTVARGQASLVLRFITTTTFASRDFRPRRGASDAHTLPGSVRSEQRRPGRKEPPSGGLRRFSVLASLLLGHSPTSGDAPSSRLARTENRRNKLGRIYEMEYSESPAAAIPPRRGVICVSLPGAICYCCPEGVWRCA